MTENNSVTPVKIDLPDSVDNAIKNITDKPSSAIGTTIADAWFLVMGGISHAADKRRMKYAHNLEEYKKELIHTVESIPEDKRIEPPIQIVAQALEKSKYCVEEKSLKDMFIKLITNSANTDYSSKVHPSFADIISQMSPLDAENLLLFKDVDALPIVRYVLGNSEEFDIKQDNVFKSDLAAIYAPLYSASMISLMRLGFVSISYDEYLTAENIYEPFNRNEIFNQLEIEHEANKLILTFKSNLSPWEQSFIDKTISFKKGIVRLTSFGRNFIDVCC